MKKVKLTFKKGKTVIGKVSKNIPVTVQENEVVYGLEIESGIMTRIVPMNEIDNNHSYLYFITEKTFILPDAEDRKIFYFSLTLKDGREIDAYDFFVTDNPIILHISIMDEGMCWYLMNEDKDDNDYVDTDELERVAKKRFGFNEDDMTVDGFEEICFDW